jgi:hypothetical protein
MENLFPGGALLYFQQQPHRVFIVRGGENDRDSLWEVSRNSFSIRHCKGVAIRVFYVYT